MVRYLLLFLLVILVTRAAWRIVGGVMRGLAGHSQHRAGGSVPDARRADGPRSCVRHLRGPRSRPRAGGRIPPGVLLFGRTAATRIAPAPHDARIRPARRHRRSRPPHVRPRIHRLERRQYQRATGRRPAPDDPQERLQGVHDAGHDVHYRPRRPEAAGRPRSLDRDADASRGLPAAARRPGRRPRAPGDGHRLRCRGHPARSRGSRGGPDDVGEHSRSRSTRRRPPRSCPTRSASTSRRTTACCSRTMAR